jgi:hypothetical protein
VKEKAKNKYLQNKILRKVKLHVKCILLQKKYSSESDLKKMKVSYIYMKRNINLPKLNLIIYIMAGSFVHKLSGSHSSFKERTAEKGRNRREEKVSVTGIVIDADAMQSIMANVRIFL